MKIVWIINGIIPEAAKQLKINGSIQISWVEAMIDELIKDNNMVICGPVSRGKLLCGESEKIVYYGVPTKNLLKFDKRMKDRFKEIYCKEKPDIIHIWGTEFPHTLSAVEAAEETKLIDRTVISIQGLVSVISKHFMHGVPNWVKYMMVPKNFIRGYNLYLTQKAFEKRGKYEISAISKVQNVIGRTEWDYACANQINPCLNYYKNNETMRKPFYQATWDRAKCVEHSIFLSQGSCPLKGAHQVIEAMDYLRNKYEDIHIKLPGKNILGKLSLIQFLRMDPYDWYLRRLIRKKNLQNSISFLGMLSAEQMCEQYQKAHVFVLPSSIENSPNSLGEAMLVGTPCVVADVGGVRSMAESDEVFLYPHDEPYMMAYYIEKAFEFDEKVAAAAKKASNHARKTHDKEMNQRELLRIYNEIAQFLSF